MIGLRDNPTCRALSPELTCYTLDLNALGLALARELVEIIAEKGGGKRTPLQLRWSMQLVLRESHGSAPHPR